MLPETRRVYVGCRARSGRNTACHASLLGLWDFATARAPWGGPAQPVRQRPRPAKHFPARFSKPWDFARGRLLGPRAHRYPGLLQEEGRGGPSEKALRRM